MNKQQNTTFDLSGQGILNNFTDDQGNFSISETSRSIKDVALATVAVAVTVKLLKGKKDDDPQVN